MKVRHVIALLLIALWIVTISISIYTFRHIYQSEIQENTQPTRDDLMFYYEKYRSTIIRRKPVTTFDYTNHNYDYDVLYGNDTQIFSRFFGSKKHKFREFIKYYKYTQSKLKESNSTKRMCFKPNNAGFGNKYFGLLSTLMIAMMSKRLFCICDWPVVYDFIQFPMEIPVYSSSELPKAAYYKFGPACPGFPQFTNHTLSQLFPSDDVIIETNCMLIPYLNKNPSLRPYYELMGLRAYKNDIEKKKLFVHHQLLHYFVVPSKLLNQYYSRIWNQFPKGSYLGLQLRTGDKADFSNHSKKPFMSDEVLESLIQEAIRLSSTYPPPIRWFVVSDCRDLKYKLYRRFPKYVVYYNSTIDHPSIESIFHNSFGSFDALSEIYLLSKCRDIVITPKSTFGKLARAIRGKGDI